MATGRVDERGDESGRDAVGVDLGPTAVPQRRRRVAGVPLLVVPQGAEAFEPCLVWGVWCDQDAARPDCLSERRVVTGEDWDPADLRLGNDPRATEVLVGREEEASPPVHLDGVGGA